MKALSVGLPGWPKSSVLTDAERYGLRVQSSSRFAARAGGSVAVASPRRRGSCAKGWGG